jgi:hypothetical protein
VFGEVVSGKGIRLARWQLLRTKTKREQLS